MNYLGIDGCPLGWFGVLVSDDGTFRNYLSVSLKNILQEVKFDTCFIDIPISLSESSYARECDVVLRNLLPSKFKSSVFNAPVKASLNAESYSEACQINESFTGKKISLQIWNILPKIREVNEFIRKNQRFSKRIFEAHPETFFYRLNNDDPLNYKKKTKEGRRERLELLHTLDIDITQVYDDVISSTKRMDLAYDDVLDAIVQKNIFQPTWICYQLIQ
jgi:predicted RNase H-like nuclease